MLIRVLRMVQTKMINFVNVDVQEQRSMIVLPRRLCFPGSTSKDVQTNFTCLLHQLSKELYDITANWDRSQDSQKLQQTFMNRSRKVIKLLPTTLISFYLS